MQSRCGELISDYCVETMTRYKYEITKHPSSDFNQLVYFCTDHGECDLAQVPSDQTELLEKILNERGEKGWELVQIFFGNDGIVAFWKKAI